MNTSIKFSSLIVLVAMSAVVAHAAPVTQLKVMSFNIWLQGGTSLSSCIQAIRTNNADIVGLQECNATTAQTIATQLGYFYVQGAGAAECAIVSRYPIVFNIGATTVAYGGIGAVIEISPGQRVHFFSAHLNYTPYGPYWLKDGSNTTAIIAMENSSRMPGLTNLLASAAPYLATSEPAFLVGDFNAPSHLDYANLAWPTSVACENAGLKDSYRELHPGNRTYPGVFSLNEAGITWTPRGLSSEPNGVYDRIDFIHYALGDGVTPTSSTELDASNSNVNPWPSDHRAMITTFILTPPTLGSTAGSPLPANNATNVSTTTLLSWLPASNMISQAIYFGTNSPGTFRTNTTSSVFSPGPLALAATYFWRVDTTTASGTITGAVWSFTIPALPYHAYEWTFALSNLTAALGDGTLEFRDTATSNLTTFGMTDGTVVPHIGGQPTPYMRVPTFSSQASGYLATFTDSGPNGGGSYLNQYTIIQDIRIPAALGWTALFNTDTGNASGNDADFYISNLGAIGSTPGYSANSLIAANTWYRIATVTDLAARTLTYYVNGTRVRQTTAADGVEAVDGRWAIYSNVNPGADLLLFNEGDTSGNYTHTNHLSAWAFADRAMTDAEIAALGGPKAAGIFPGTSLLATSTITGTNIVINWSGGKGPFRVQRAAALSSPVWQDANAPSYNRTFSEPATNGNAFYRVIGS